MTQNQGSATAEHNANAGAEDQKFLDQQKRAEKAEAEAKQAKEVAADLQKQLDAARASGGSNAVIPEEAIVEIAKKHDIDPEFAKDLGKVLLTHSVAAAEAKFIPMLKEQEEQAKKEKIESEFNKAFDTATAVEKYKGIAIDKDSVRQLQFANPTQTVEQIVERLYGSVAASSKEEGKETTEEARNGAQRGGDVVDFEKMTPDQRDAVMADPEAKKKYFAWLDSKGK